MFQYSTYDWLCVVMTSDSSYLVNYVECIGESLYYLYFDLIMMMIFLMGLRSHAIGDKGDFDLGRPMKK